MKTFDRTTLTEAEMEWHFNPRVTFPNHVEYMRTRAETNARVLEKLERLPNFRYGPNPLETLDIYPSKGGLSPVLVYIHGGYWRAGYKEDWTFVAEPLIECGATVVVLNYDLCPTVSLDELVSEIRRAIIWIYQNVKQYGGNPSKMYISGSSAGAHLCAMMLAQDWSKHKAPHDLVKGATLITGIYDIHPVINISVNADIKLDKYSAQRNSPMFLPPLMTGPILAAVGGKESEGWKQQTHDYVSMCRKNDIKCDFMELPDEDHFSLGSILGDPGSPLVRATLQQMGLM